MSWADDNLSLGMEDLILDYYYSEENNYYTTIIEVNDNYELKTIVVWEDKTGKKHKINEMSTSYILKCINYIIRNNFRKCYLPLFKKELEKRGYNNI